MQEPDDCVQSPVLSHVVVWEPTKLEEQVAVHTLPPVAPMQLAGKPPVLAGADGSAPLHTAHTRATQGSVESKPRRASNFIISVLSPPRSRTNQSLARAGRLRAPRSVKPTGRRACRHQPEAGGAGACACRAAARRGAGARPHHTGRL